MTRDDMFHALTLRYEELVCKYANKNVTDEQFFNELCCSVYAGEEFEKSEQKKQKKQKKVIKLNDNCCFKYKDYTFELTPCTMLNSKQQVIDVAGTFICGRTKGIFTDRYVCWMFGHKDDDGHTLKEYLELNPNETAANNCWAPNIYLVPKAWAWGADPDCNPGTEVQDFILEYIDEFLEQNPDL